MNHTILLSLSFFLFLSVSLSKPTSPCQQIPDAGPCEAAIPSWFFDNVTARCRKFLYGGCSGTVPFSTRRSCVKAKCRAIPPTPHPPLSDEQNCAAVPERGPCMGNLGRWFFNPSTAKCTRFSWSGCFGTVPFRRRRDCKRAKCEVDRCMLDPVPGPCRASFVRYFFDKKTKTCKKFIYGGCKGVVPFTTLEACEKKCNIVDPCKLKPDPGPCKGSISKYFYDPLTKTCKEFFYGGCKGVVPFDTSSECEEMCVEPCDLKPDMGPCEAAITRYFYNPTSRKCESFTWGGCQGTVPFISLDACQNRQCQCKQKAVPGPCKAFFRRYFFNQQTNMCEQFIYGGCRGSVPFDELEDCEDLCETAVTAISSAMA